MLFQSQALVRVVVTVGVLSVVVASAASARDSHTGVGSAIVPVFSVQHDAMRPEEDVTLVLCVTNGNAHSHRNVEPGDSFVFDFGEGEPGPCGEVTVSSRGALVSDSDLSCSVDGQAVTIRYDGQATEWIPGATLCTELAYRSGRVSGTVLPLVGVGTRGAYAPPQPLALAVTVSRDIGSVGPVGPQGPEGERGPVGPSGPPGPVGMGQAEMVVSTASVSAGSSDVLVPGLETTVTVGESSRLLVAVELVEHEDCVDYGEAHARALLAVDGAVVASRNVDQSAGGAGKGSLTLVWLSEPLGVGDHQLSVLISKIGPSSFTQCFGSTEDYGGVQARMVYLELRD